MLKSRCSFDILKNWSIIKISGVDSTKYLNSQITINVFNLKKNKHILCAHCNSNGKVYSTLRLFCHEYGYFYILRRSVCELQIKALKKYSVFSDFKIQILYDYVLFGVIGIDARIKLLSYFFILPDQKNPVIYLKDIIILWFYDPIERFLIICNKIDFIKIKNYFFKKKILYIYNRWLFLDIKAGIPIIEYNIYNNFFPQEINLYKFNGLDFKKGCYCGQEMISKLHFRNINKKQLYCLIGISLIPVINFSMIEIYDGEKWKIIGKIVFVLYIKKNMFILQCILHKKYIFGHTCRILKNNTSYFFIV